MASGLAEEKAQYAITRLTSTSGKVHLADRAVNLLAVEGGVTEIAMPDIIPGKARDLILRVTTILSVTKLLYFWSPCFAKKILINCVATTQRKN